jgi:hypothetical protein
MEAAQRAEELYDREWGEVFNGEFGMERDEYLKV